MNILLIIQGTLADYKKQLEESTTLYVGNLNRLSTEADVRRVFSQAGNIKSIIMGVEKKTGAPGEFCFVEYVRRSLFRKIFIFFLNF